MKFPFSESVHEKIKNVQEQIQKCSLDENGQRLISDSLRQAMAEVSSYVNSPLYTKYLYQRELTDTNTIFVVYQDLGSTVEHTEAILASFDENICKSKIVKMESKKKRSAEIYHLQTAHVENWKVLNPFPDSGSKIEKRLWSEACMASLGEYSVETFSEEELQDILLMSEDMSWRIESIPFI